MTSIELMHLKNFCREFEIDAAEIDSSANYYENRAHLRKYRLKTIDQLAEEWAKIVPRGKMDSWTGLREVFQEAYSSALGNINEVLSEQTEGVLMDWYLIGKEIQIARERMRLEGIDVSKKGWSGWAGKLMTQLSDDLHQQRNELYDAVRFVQKFPNWEAFAEREFDVPRKKGGDLESFKISGSGLSWNQVRKFVLRECAVKSTLRPNLCWACGKKFFSESAPVCGQCKTFVCPDGHCFCKVPEVVQKAIDYEMMSRGPQPPRWSSKNSKWLKSLYSHPTIEPDTVDKGTPVETGA